MSCGVGPSFIAGNQSFGRIDDISAVIEKVQTGRMKESSSRFVISRFRCSIALDSVGWFTCSLLESDRLNEFDSLEDSACFDSWV